MGRRCCTLLWGKKGCEPLLGASLVTLFALGLRSWVLGVVLAKLFWRMGLLDALLRCLRLFELGCRWRLLTRSCLTV